MLSRKSLRTKKCSPVVSSLSRTLASTGIVTFTTCRAACAILLILAATMLVLHAQTPTGAEQRAKCEADVLNSGNASEAKPPDNIADGTKAALACEWIDPEGVVSVLAAFHLLTTAPRTASPKALLRKLDEGDPYPVDRDFYSAAIGVPDEKDQLTGQGLADFVDILAKANTLKKKAPDDEDALFASTKAIIQLIFCTETGKLNLVRVNDSFQRKNNYIALRQLLEAYPADKNDRVSYARILELLRAAFEMNTDKLAKQVSGKITAAKN
jgi:hypothetical protein